MQCSILTGAQRYCFLFVLICKYDNYMCTNDKKSIIKTGNNCVYYPLKHFISSSDYLNILRLREKCYSGEKKKRRTILEVRHEDEERKIWRIAARGTVQESYHRKGENYDGILMLI